MWAAAGSRAGAAGMLLVGLLLAGLSRYPKSLAFIVSTMVRLLLPKVTTKFSMKSFSLLPLFIEEFCIEIPSKGKSPDIHLSWTTMRLSINWRWIFDCPARWARVLLGYPVPNTPFPLFLLDFQSLHAGSSTVQFKHFLEPKAQGQPPGFTADAQISDVHIALMKLPLVLRVKELARQLQAFVSAGQYAAMTAIACLVELRFGLISFDFKMPANECAIQGYADAVTISLLPSETLGHEGFKMLSIFQGGAVDIFDAGELAIQYVGHAARMAMHYHHPTKMMDIYVNLYGRDDDLAVYIKPFLSFYIKYQRAEDDGLETKLARGLPLAGKMAIYAEFEFMKISVRDDRCPRLLILEVEKVKGEFASFPLTLDKKRTHKGRLCDPNPTYNNHMIPPLLQPATNMGPNVAKVMKASVGKVTFFTRKDAAFATNHTEYSGKDAPRYVAEGVSMVKTLEVHNENDFVDDDFMEMVCRSANFEHVDTELLHWLVALQDTSERLPISRFSHRKRVKMPFKCESFLFSVQPLAHDFDLFVPENSYLHTADASTPLLPQLPLDSDRWVVFCIRNMEMERVGQTGVLMSQFFLKMGELIIHTYTPLSDLLSQYELHTCDGFNGSTAADSGSSDSDDETRTHSARTSTKATDHRGQTFADLLEAYEHHQKPIRDFGQKSLEAQAVSIWTFERFSTAFLLGPRLELQHISVQQFTLALDTFCPQRGGCAQGQPSGNTKYNLVRIFSNVPNVLGLEAVWEGPSMALQIDQLDSNANTFGGIAALCTFSMIKQAVNRINFNTTAAKLRAPDLSRAQKKREVNNYYNQSSVAAINAAKAVAAVGVPAEAGPPPSSTPVVSKMALRQATVVVAVECNSNTNHLFQSLGGASANSDPGNHCMVVYLYSLAMESCEGRIGVEMLACDLKTSKFPAKPFFSLTSFAFSKDMNSGKIVNSVPVHLVDCSMTTMSLSVHPKMELGILADAILLQLSAFKVATHAVPNLLESLLEGDTFEVSDMDMYDLYGDSTFSLPDIPPEDAALLRGDSLPSVDSGFPTAKRERVVERATEPFQISTVKLARFEVNLDAPWEGIYKSDLFAMSFKSLVVIVDSTLPAEQVEDNICVLDLGADHLSSLTPDALLHYVNISGGILKMTAAEWEINLTTQKETLMRMTGLEFSGPCYSAGVQDSRIPMEIKLIDVNNALLISDIVSHSHRPKMAKQTSVTASTFAQKAASSDPANGAQESGPWNVAPVRCVPLYALFSSQHGANKVYCDMDMKAEGLVLHVFPDTLKAINVVNAVIEICQPPNRDPSPLLPFWDSYRYWIHGPLNVKMGTVDVLYHAAYYMQQEVVISLRLMAYQLFIHQSNFEVTTEQINIGAEFSVVKLAQRKRSQRFNKEQSVKSEVTFVTLPSVVLAVQHVHSADFQQFQRKVHSKQSYTHHDVYLLPALEAMDGTDCIDASSMASGPQATPASGLTRCDLRYIERDLLCFRVHGIFSCGLPYLARDRFYHFRSRPCSVRYNVEMRLADTPTDPILMLLRLDNLIRVMDSINYTEHVHTPPTSSRAAVPIIMTSHGIPRVASPMSVGTLICGLDMQIVINKALLASWTSASCLLGVILHQQLIELQVRFLRAGAEGVYAPALVDSPTGLIPEVDAAVYPMQIDHLVVDIYFAEIYARDMNISGMDESSPGRLMSRSFKLSSPRPSAIATTDAGEAVTLKEPSEVVHVFALMKAIHRVAYASKVVVSLTESGEVASKLNTFQSTGILSARDEADRGADPSTSRVTGRSAAPSKVPKDKDRKRSTFLIGKDWRRVSGGFAGDTVDGARLSRMRRSALSPGGHSAPHSARHRGSSVSSLTLATGRRKRFSFGSHVVQAQYSPRTHGYRASLLYFGNNHAAFAPPAFALPDSYKTSVISFNNKVVFPTQQAADENSSFGGKIWGLRVADTKFLFTIAIRDSLFMFVSRANVFLNAGAGEDSEGPGLARAAQSFGDSFDEDDSARELPIYNISLNNVGTEVRKRRGSHFMRSRDASNGNKATVDDFLSVGEELGDISPPTPHLINLASQARRKARRASVAADAKKLGSSAIASHLLTVPADSPNVANVHFDFALADLDAPTASGSGDAAETKEVEQLSTNMKDRTYISGGRGIKRSSAVRRRSLFNKGIEMRSERTLVGVSTPDAPPAAPPILPPATAENLSGRVAGKSGKQKVKAGTNQYFFIVELVDPQLNFLDVDSHSSLIIVAGRSSLEGKRLSTATLSPQRSGVVTDTADEETDANTPKRRQEIRLKMDNVCAYTVPSLTSDEDESDEVFWKSTQSTVDNYNLRPLQKREEGPAHGAKTAALSSLPRKVYRDSKDAGEPAAMSMAIKDFQIRACYIFWTDVTVEEAKTLKVVRSKDDLVCTFRLELPSLSVDVNSKQFHIVTNVIKNVLLEPPPHLPSRADREEASSKNVIELKRNADLLAAKTDGRLVVNTGLPLDIRHKTAREEIRAYIDDCLLSNVYDFGNPQTVRFTEVFIGRLTWVLRSQTSVGVSVTSSKVDKEYEHVESGFIGIYATLSFTKSRCINSLLEIQRFWARSLDPNDSGGVGPTPSGKPSERWVDRSAVVQPVLKEADQCTRCGSAFNIADNHSSACTFHADDDGNPGVYKQVEIIDELSKKETTIKAWSCCMRHHEFAVGCSVRPHVCREVMFSIRAEVFPNMRVDNVDMTIFKTLDISIFPGANYDLRLQITRTLSDFLHKYFSLQSVESDFDALNTAQLQPQPQQTATPSALSGPPPSPRRSGRLSTDSELEAESEGQDDSGVEEKGKEKKPKPKNLLHFIQKKALGRWRSGSEGGDAVAPAPGVWSFAAKRSSVASAGEAVATKDGTSSPERVRAERLSLVGGADATLAASQKSVKQQGLYIKYMRVGDINVDVSTVGFAFNVEKFKAVMEPFFCRGEVLTWQQLIWLFETHLVWSLTKNTAASSITRLTGMLRMKAQVNPHMIQEIEKSDPEQALILKRNLLLGSPRAPTTPATDENAPPSLKWSVGSARPRASTEKRALSPMRLSRTTSVPVATTPLSSLNVKLFSPAPVGKAEELDGDRPGTQPQRDASASRSSRARAALQADDASPL